LWGGASDALADQRQPRAATIVDNKVFQREFRFGQLGLAVFSKTTFIVQCVNEFDFFFRIREKISVRKTPAIHGARDLVAFLHRLGGETIELTVTKF
jgi:hypothetical protein